VTLGGQQAGLSVVIGISFAIYLCRRILQIR